MPYNFPNLYNDKKYHNSPLIHGSLPIMRGKVVRNSDPKKIGRIQVRIPSYHGVPNLMTKYIEDEDLPWAMPCFYGGCGQDMGSFIVPTPGSYVWLMFEDNDIEKPVYLGGVPSIGSKLSKKMNNLEDPNSDALSWDTKPNEPDIAWDEFDGKSSGVPERQIIYKSPKGHTIMCDDTDGEESMSFIDRVGQVFKFICGVTKDKNAEPYRRELNSAENNEQLGEGLVDEPSILMRSGETKDAEKIHSMFQMYRDHMRAESIDLDNEKQTTTDYSPEEYNQQTQDSIINMTEDHIYISFPKILESFYPSYYTLSAFEKCLIECTEGHMLFQYDGNGLYIDNSKVKLFYKGTEVVLDEKTANVSAEESFSFKAGESEVTGDKESISGKSKEFKFEGSGSVYTEGDKTYIVGTEVHFKRS